MRFSNIEANMNVSESTRLLASGFMMTAGVAFRSYLALLGFKMNTISGALISSLAGALFILCVLAIIPPDSLKRFWEDYSQAKASFPALMKNSSGSVLRFLYSVLFPYSFSSFKLRIRQHGVLAC